MGTELKLLLQTIVVLSATVPASSHGAAGDWPTWMGPNLNGISRESGWSTDWPDSGLAQVWSREIGIGFSSVSIVDELLYTMGHSGGKETVWCLHAESGDVVWKQSYNAERNSNLYEGGPGSTPTVDGNFVYTLSVDGLLACFNRKTGDVIWERDLQRELDVGLHEWGFNSSPLILRQQLIVQGGRVVSFDKTTGRKNWQSQRHRAGYGSVRAFSHRGETLLASLDCDGLRISTAQDGDLVAFEEWKSPFGTNSTTPIVAGDMIYISSGYNVGCGLFRLGDGELREVYRSRRMRNHFNNSILLDGYLYGMDGNSNLGRVVTLTCMNYQTGEVRWKHRGPGCGSLMIANDRLLILSEDGILIVAEATPDDYIELARSPFLEGRCWTVPVLLDGRVYGRNAAGNLKCVQLPPE
ncbi:MAG: PQQ-like beta-propeller repeat protein [Fuerstiella sp.]|nr:PQQ-like beta-propeller repeat protein [Fuerstiella sp.]